jgi:hypothetical protein
LQTGWDPRREGPHARAQTLVRDASRQTRRKRGIDSGLARTPRLQEHQYLPALQKGIQFRSGCTNQIKVPANGL